MTHEDTSNASPANQASKRCDYNLLKIRPAIVIVAAMWLIHIWASIGETAALRFMPGKIIAPGVCTLLLIGWWYWINRAQKPSPIRDLVVILLASVAAILIAGKNFPALGLILYALPTICSGWVAWLIVSSFLDWPTRRIGVLCLWIVAGVIYSLLRIDGMDGKFQATINWRWTPTSEAKLLSELKSTTDSTPSADVKGVEELVLQEGDWPEFRGKNRNSRVDGVRIRTDWDQVPPIELWRHRVGPGWSSCSIIGHHLFTQEQRGDEEFVVCYHTETGKEIWKHGDRTRFEDVVAGAGPRATPTFHEGRIYSLGATGKLNCLNAATGKPIWQADILKDSKVEKPPQWGFAGSPLICEGRVSVFAGGADGKGVVAYEIDTGKLAWLGVHGKQSGEGLLSYSSTEAVTIRGHKEILIVTNKGLTSLQPDNGATLWEHSWKVDQPRVAQPVALDDSNFLLATGLTGGIRKVQLYFERDIWWTRELWTTKNFKPYSNDFVIFENHIYGFDSTSAGSVFACISLDDGALQWRYRGHGNGQVLLIADDGVLLVTTESGDVVLVAAKPDAHQELTRFKALEGKTWNHPVLAHEKLFLRNAEEMACYSMPMNTTAKMKPPESSDAQEQLEPQSPKEQKQ